METRKEKEKLIYRYTHNDYKGTKNGIESIMPPFGLFDKKTYLLELSNLSDSDFDRLWEFKKEFILNKEARGKNVRKIVVESYGPTPRRALISCLEHALKKTHDMDDITLKKIEDAKTISIVDNN